MDIIQEFHEAVDEEDHKRVVKLIQQGADVNAPDKSGRPPLHNAITNDSGDIVTALIDNGADVEKLSKDGVAPLHVAASVGNPDMINYLIEKEAEVNVSGTLGLPLHEATKNGHVKAVETLLRNGSIFTKYNSSKETPLSLAASSKYPEIQDIYFDLCKIGNHLEPNSSPILAAMHQVASELYTNDYDFCLEMDILANEIVRKLRVDLLSYSINKYIDAELDFKSDGKRGLGRMTDYIPRLGAYFRKNITPMNQFERFELRCLLQQLIIGSYFARALYVGNISLLESTISKQDLYRKWIPGIYTQGGTEKSFLLILSKAVESAYDSLLEFFHLHQMKGGGFLRQDKTKTILYAYMIAGAWLRECEMEWVD